MSFFRLLTTKDITPWKTSWSTYLFAGPLFHKTLETGVQFLEENQGVDVYFHFTTCGDKAGLRFHIDLWWVYFEFNVTDDRSWNADANRFRLPSEEVEFHGYPY